MTAAIIWKEGRVLITKRPEGSHLEGLWEFPGGKQEGKETLKECLIREIKEELGMEILPDSPLLTVRHEYETKWITLYTFNCIHLKGHPSPMEGQETRWVAPGDLRTYTFPPPDNKVIELLTPDEAAKSHKS